MEAKQHLGVFAFLQAVKEDGQLDGPLTKVWTCCFSKEVTKKRMAVKPGLNMVYRRILWGVCPWQRRTGVDAPDVAFGKRRSNQEKSAPQVTATFI
jgi:hypothetical protein